MEERGSIVPVSLTRPTRGQVPVGAQLACSPLEGQRKHAEWGPNEVHRASFGKSGGNHLKSGVKRDPTKPDKPLLTANRIPAERAPLLWKADSSWLCCSMKAWVTSDFCKQEMNGDTKCHADSRQDTSMDDANPPRPR